MRPCSLTAFAASKPILMNRGGSMWGRRNTQPGLVELILAGMLVVSGCSEGKETERVGAGRVSIAETSTPKPASSTADSSNSPIDVASPEIVDVESAESLPVTEPPDEPATSAEELPVLTDTEIPTSPTGESPPANEVATDASEEDTTSEEELVAVSDTKPGLTRIGATKCKMCHKVQYASWAETKHAERTPPLDCESCHGSGSEYKKKSIMEDPEMARAAGLVVPGKSFCGSCHQDDWQDDMLERTHAHKDDDAG
jgi:hypothetical protein